MLCRRDFACAPLLEPNGLRAWPPWMTKRFRRCHSCWDCRFFCEEIGWNDSFADPIFPLVLTSVCFLSETKSGISYLPEWTSTKNSDFSKGGVHKTNGFWWVIFKGGSTQNRWLLMGDFSKGGAHKTDGLLMGDFSKGGVHKTDGLWNVFLLLLNIKRPGAYFCKYGNFTPSNHNERGKNFEIFFRNFSSSKFKIYYKNWRILETATW